MASALRVLSPLQRPASLVAAAHQGGRARAQPLVAARRALVGTRWITKPAAGGGRFASAGGFEARSGGVDGQVTTDDLDSTIFEDVDETSPPPSSAPEGWEIKYLFDGGCSVCNSLVAMLKGRRGHEKIWFEDISAPTFKADQNKGITYDEAMKTIHVIRKKNETILMGMDALTALYQQVGLGWVFKAAKLPGISYFAELAYKMISKNRMAIGGGMDTMLAIGRIGAEEKGEGSCSDPEGECREKPPPEPDVAIDKDDKPLVRGGVSDRRNVLAIYTFKGGEGFRAAPVDTETGKFTRSGRVYKLDSIEFDVISTTVQRIVSDYQWLGAIGIGLPGLVSRNAEGGDEFTRDDLELIRKSRGSLETRLKKATKREIAVMSGAEANGYGEMNYGAGKGRDGLILMVTIGRGVGVAIFDDGVLVRNVGLTHITWSWGLEMWEDAALPSSVEEDVDKWKRWAGRVESYLERLIEEIEPDTVIVGGLAAASMDKWRPHMRELGAEIIPAKLGPLAGVKGAGAGGAEQLLYKDDLAAVRAAIGRSQGISPQAITRDQLHDIFRKFDTDGNGELDAAELDAVLRKLGVTLSKREQKEMFYDVDTNNDGGLSFPEFYSWWTELVTTSPVTFIQSEKEFDNVLEENITSGRLVVLQVGFTYCRPCKAFAPTYKKFAEKFSDARFLRVYGNENSEMVHLGRDRLKVKSTPSFFLFRSGEEVYRHTGANHERFEDAILGALLPGEAGYEADYVRKSDEYWAELKKKKKEEAAA